MSIAGDTVCTLSVWRERDSKATEQTSHAPISTRRKSPTDSVRCTKSFAFVAAMIVSIGSPINFARYAPWGEREVVRLMYVQVTNHAVAERPRGHAEVDGRTERIVAASAYERTS